MSTTLALQVVATALLSAAATGLLAWLAARRAMGAQLERRLAEIQAEFEARVKSGVLAAGTELLPALREQVKLGFQDALRETQTGAMVETYASAVNRSADALSQRLGGLFGGKPRK